MTIWLIMLANNLYAMTDVWFSAGGDLSWRSKETNKPLDWPNLNKASNLGTHFKEMTNSVV